MASGIVNSRCEIDDNGDTILSKSNGTLSSVVVDDSDEPRFLMQGLGFASYQVLVNLIWKIGRGQHKAMPPEIVRHIATFFTTKRLDPNKSRALTCSSSSGQYSLDECLVDSENSWWISSFGSFRNGEFCDQSNDIVAQNVDSSDSDFSS
jgi:hypothetical protein